MRASRSARLQQPTGAHGGCGARAGEERRRRDPVDKRRGAATRAPSGAPVAPRPLEAHQAPAVGCHPDQRHAAGVECAQALTVKGRIVVIINRSHGATAPSRRGVAFRARVQHTQHTNMHPRSKRDGHEMHEARRSRSQSHMRDERVSAP